MKKIILICSDASGLYTLLITKKYKKVKIYSYDIKSKRYKGIILFK